MVLRILAFLAFWTLINSFRRAFANPVRAVLTVGVVMFVLLGWGGMLLATVMEDGRTVSVPQTAGDSALILTRSLAIAVFIHWLYVLSLGISALFRPIHLLFQESDVHYLFTSPLCPLSLFRGLLLIRGLLGALASMAMLLVYVIFFGGRSVTRLITTVEPIMNSWALLIYPILYLLAFVGVLFVSVAIALREIQGRSVRRAWIVGFVGWAILSVLVVGGKLYQESGSTGSFMTALVHALEWLPAKILLIPVRGLADGTLILYQGWTPAITASFLFWGSLVLWGNGQLVQNRGWLYELGAELARLGGKVPQARQDPMRAYIERAMERAQKKPLRTLGWLERWTPSGVLALLWRDLLIAWRASGWTNVLVIVFVALVPIGLMALVAYRSQSPPSPKVLQSIYISVQSAIAFFYAFGSYYGMTDLLRRIEWQKPMPFASWQVVLVESLPTVIFFMLSQMLAICLAIGLFPNLWLYWLVGGLAVTAWLWVLQMAMFTVALVNPNPSDYTQRLLTSFIMVPLLCLGGVPGATVWIVGSVLKWHVVLTGLITLGVQALVGMVLVAISATLYERFSPND